MRAKLLALLAGTAIAVTATTPAHATTWDGVPFEFGYGSFWSIDRLRISDVDLGSEAVPFGVGDDEAGLYTDLWDGPLDIDVTSPTAGVNDNRYECANADDIDVTLDGDLDLQCTTDWSLVTNEDVSIRGSLRIYGPDGDLVRFVLAITNNSSDDITDFVVTSETDFGSNGNIWDYQNYDETVLASGLDNDDVDNSSAIEETGSDWISTYSDGDPPGSVAWGNAGGSVDVFLAETDSDSFYTESDEFTVRAGETVYLAYFVGWDPVTLVEIGYVDNGFPDEGDDILAADAVAEAAAEFDEFSGRLNDGLEDANVLNWGPDPGAELADTGVDASGIALGGALVLGAGVAVAIRRRARA